MSITAASSPWALRELISSLGGEHIIEFTVAGNGQTPALDADSFRNLPAVNEARTEADRICLSVSEPHIALPALLERLDATNRDLTGLTTRHASLEDVFVKLAGRHLSEADQAPNA